MLEELDGLRLDGVRVGKVLAQLLAHVVRLELAQRRLDREIERRGEPFAHALLLVADPLRFRDRLLIARTLGHADEELVCGQLEMLIRVRMRDELARRVRLRAREQEEARAADLHEQVLELVRALAVRFQPSADRALVPLGLRQVVAEDVGETGVARRLRRALQLLQRLLLDRVGVCQVLHELFVDSRHASLVPPSTSLNRLVLRTSEGRAPPRRAVCTESGMFPSPTTEWASVEHTMAAPAASASRTCSPLRSSLGASPFTSSATPVSIATSKTRSRSSAFSGLWPMSLPVGWLRQRTAGCRIASMTRAVISRRGARCPACSESCTYSSSASTSSGRSSVPSRRMSHSAPRRMRNGASTSFAAAISSACRRSASASSPGTTVTFGVWSQIAMYSYPRARAASPIASTLAFPSDHVVCTCRSPRISSRETSSGTSDVGTPSRSSGGTNGRPRRSKTPASSGASGSGSSAATHSGEPVARTSAVPNASGDATWSSTGMPSTVTPTFGATIATISGTESSSLRAGA